MRLKTKFAVITVILAVPAFLFGRVIWPPYPDNPVPTGIQLPLLMFVSAIEALGFGAGIAFFVLGWKYTNSPNSPFGSLTKPVFLSLIWALVSWWPHDNLHQHIGMNLQKLIYIEYTFHFTLVTTAVLISYAVFKLLRKQAVS